MSSSPPLSGRAIRGMLYTHNPFYLLSALLVLIGLHKALAGDSSLAGGWLLMGTLCGYTLLLVVAGYVIVRFGQVWEDARMILLVIVLLFLALSVSFDRITLARPLSGAGFLLGGWCFAVLVSEAVFRSLAIRLAASYRVPYYLVLALMFAYPVGLAVLSVEGRDVAMSWGVFLFPVAAAAALLMLSPAARRRGQDEPPSGTPWRWPWFPWTLFFFLLLAVGLRTYSLSMAFEAAKGSAVSFQPYFLTPLVLASAALLFEAAMANGSRRAAGGSPASGRGLVAQFSRNAHEPGGRPLPAAALSQPGFAAAAGPGRAGRVLDDGLDARAANCRTGNDWLRGVGQSGRLADGRLQLADLRAALAARGACGLAIASRAVAAVIVAHPGGIDRRSGRNLGFAMVARSRFAVAVRAGSCPGGHGIGGGRDV